VFIVSFCGYVDAQETIKKIDSSKTKTDSIRGDTLKSDTLKKDNKSKNSNYALSSKVDYKAIDSIRFDIAEEKVYLYGKAEIKYEDIDLTADYIEINFKKNQLFAKGITDTSGKINGIPIFKQGEESFTSATLTYNFKTKKGIISDIITKEGDSYLHGISVKKFADNSINVKNGMYTTCDDKDPHFEIKFGRARVIPDDKIVTGPAYLVVEDVPLPIGVPFGFFPNKKGQTSGIIFPTYGQSTDRGFFLNNGGYYFGLGQFMDLALKGDVYSNGSWALHALSNYKMRYHYFGNLELDYAINILGDKGTPDYSKNKSFFIRWNDNQDPKANPNSHFQASVNGGSTNYNTYNTTSTEDYLTNTFQSSISYTTAIGDKCNFSVNMNDNQNMLTHAIELNLPEIAFSVSNIYPFRSENNVGKPKWYDKISVGYTMNAENNFNTIDTLLFPKNSTFNFQHLQGLMSNGIEQKIPISWSGQLTKNVTWTVSGNINDRSYFQTIEKHWVKEMRISGSDTSYYYRKTDTIHGFGNEYDYNMSTSLSTHLYGMYTFNKGSIIAIRHVLTPTISFVYTPDFGSQRYGYYRYLRSNKYPNGTPDYSIFEGGIYGTAPEYRSESINYSLANNLEMKVRSKKDTVTGTKKIVLIDNLTFSGGYDVAKDSLNWSKITISGRTTIFKNFNITYTSLWDPYRMNDSTGQNINKFEWKVDKHNFRLFRMSSTDWALSLNWSLHSKTKKKDIKSKKASQEELDMIKAHPDAYVDFDQPWNVTLSYSFNYSRAYDIASELLKNTIVQTMGVNGDVNLTPKWKVGFTSGYDFVHHQLSYTTVNIYRDLHCWEIAFNWIPIGARKSYMFTLHVKSSVLEDLKLTKKTDWRDNQNQ
jgi:lipopolysaccharide assembly outer membrane protein LptD (OstA)